MGRARRNVGPTSVGGGRSNRYEARHAQREYVRRNAPPWGDASARGVLAALRTGAQLSGSALEMHTAWVLGDLGRTTRLISRSGMGLTDRRTASEVMEAYVCRLASVAGDGPRQTRVVRSFLKPLRERASVYAEAKPFDVDRASSGPATFHAWLSERPEEDRHREISDSQRIVRGLRRWPLGWLAAPGVICYERANGRVNTERHGRADAEFLKGVVRVDHLPTATANSSDHYVLLAPGKAPRFLTVQEVARGFMVSHESPLMEVLVNENLLSAGEAVSCLGRAVHVGVARQIVVTLLRRGLLRDGLTYASAFSGVDTVAAAVEAEMPGNWSYVFASELNARWRSALLAAWGGRGLTPDMCYTDALAPGALAGGTVDLYVTTPPCEAFSKMNHVPTAGGQHVSLHKFWESLAYVRRARPRVVLVENVTDASAAEPMTGLLARLAGYYLETNDLDPRDVACAPMARERRFWCLVRVGD